MERDVQVSIEEGEFTVSPAALEELMIRRGDELLALIEPLLDTPTLPVPLQLSMLLCDDARIRPLNAEYRGKDQATDVLSFPVEPPILGDIVISVQTASRRVDEPRWLLDDELLFLLIHGLLHLLGHDHEQDAERAIMEAEEQRLWEALGRTEKLR